MTFRNTGTSTTATRLQSFQRAPSSDSSSKSNKKINWTVIVTHKSTIMSSLDRTHCIMSCKKRKESKGKILYQHILRIKCFYINDPPRFKFGHSLAWVYRVYRCGKFATLMSQRLHCLWQSGDETPSSVLDHRPGANMEATQRGFSFGLSLRWNLAFLYCRL